MLLNLLNNFLSGAFLLAGITFILAGLTLILGLIPIAFYCSWKENNRVGIVVFGILCLIEFFILSDAVIR